MKVKVLKPHYYESSYRNVGVIYSCDVEHGKSVITRKLCEKVVETRKRKPKRK